jgi:regulator of sigma E protease
VIFTCLFTFFGKPSTTARVDKIEADSAAERPASRSATS